MALNGAKHLYAVDISKINTIKTKNTLKKFNFKIKTFESPAERAPLKVIHLILFGVMVLLCTLINQAK